MSDLQVAVDGIARAEGSARNHAISLMVQHLHDEHGYGPYAIASRLGMRPSEVKRLLDRRVP